MQFNATLVFPKSSLPQCIRADTIRFMNSFQRTSKFDAWLKALRDPIGKARIISRIRSAEAGNFGDCEPVGEGVSEMRIHYGPGYRVYYSRKGDVVYLLLCGGNKSTQNSDIKQAKALLKSYEG